MTMISWLPLLITALAVARLTRIITTDRIALPIRQYVLAKNGDDGWFTFLIHCKYCASVWIAAGTAPLYWYFGRSPWFLIPAVALAFAEFIVFTAKLDEV